MTDSMVERVARAICPEYDELPDIASYSQRKRALPEQYWKDKSEVRDDARAAIEAMREPTAIMWRRGSETRTDDHSTGEIYRAMIDAALDDGTGPIPIYGAKNKE